MGPSDPFRRSSTLCRLTAPPHTSLLPPPPHPPQSMPLGLLETEPLKTLSTALPPSPPLRPRPAWSWLLSLCSQVASVQAMACDTPSGLCLEAQPAVLTTSVTLRTSGWAAAPPPPRHRAKEQCSAPPSRCCPTSLSPEPSYSLTEAWLPGRKAAVLALEVDIPLLL